LPQNLKRLDLSGCEQLTDEALKYLPQGLKELALRNPNFTDAAFKNLPENLELLNLFGNDQLNDEALKHLPKGLRFLVLQGCTKITDAAIRNLREGLSVSR
jgi:hypothetical protein